MPLAWPGPAALKGSEQDLKGGADPAGSAARNPQIALDP
jgi:hypothetical protein